MATATFTNGTVYTFRCNPEPRMSVLVTFDNGTELLWDTGMQTEDNIIKAVYADATALIEQALLANRAVDTRQVKRGVCAGIKEGYEANQADYATNPAYFPNICQSGYDAGMNALRELITA